MSNRLLLASALFVPLAVAGCHIDFRSDYGNDGTLLASKADGTDGKRELRLYPGDDGNPSLNVVTTTKHEKAFLGVTTADVDLARSKQLGVDAWKGVEVTSVTLDSAASRSGLVRGDVITAVNDAPVTSIGMFQELVQSKLTPHETTRVSVLRRASEGTTPMPLALDLQPDVRSETKTETQRIPLTQITGLKQYTGLQVVGLPADASKDAYSASDPAAVIAGVVPGSPAYLAGLRSGDRVVSVDGKPVKSVDDVRAAAAARVRALGLPARDLGDPGSVAPSEAPLSLAVDGPLGAHTADVALIPDLDETTTFHFPILFSFDSNPSKTEWSFLDFIFQFGATYESRYLSSPTRSERMTSELSMLPFGMFEIKRTPTENRYTALWFIKWGKGG